MLQRCQYCGELMFYKEKGHGKGVCDIKGEKDGVN